MGLWGDRVVPRITDFALRGRDLGESRRLACAGLSGRVLEIGFGGGLNVVHYPDTITQVGAVEPSDLGWELSARRRARSTVAIERIGLDGQHVDADDDSYDAALCTFTLCTIPDPSLALAEVARVVRPGGWLHFLEHGSSDDAGVRSWQRRFDPLQRRLVGGCHLTRDPVALLTAAGYAVGQVRTGRLDGFTGPAALTFGYLGSAQVPPGPSSRATTA